MRNLFNGLVFFLLLISSCKSQDTMIDKTVVKELDVDRYLGKWYEIARFDHSFERGLVGVSATYSYREDGKIKVVNAGFKETLQGERSEAIGKAKIPNKNVPSKLKVSFFWFFYGDYFVLDLDKDYQWAIVGSSTDKYLWILSRTPQIKDDLYNDLLVRLNERGYDVSKLIKVEQSIE
ncbi:lipocalin family protein [Marinifilum sp. N1E240]|uniref:lipocalin family protein n=1 Tax=Marinifilum sp. N1E240 TaxID=2608082 RepID=UPI001D03E25A|nr:lipocalin family protein [Marinifilum sp. N1E240]